MGLSEITDFFVAEETSVYLAFVRNVLLAFSRVNIFILRFDVSNFCWCFWQPIRLFTSDKEINKLLVVFKHSRQLRQVGGVELSASEPVTFTSEFSSCELGTGALQVFVF